MSLHAFIHLDDILPAGNNNCNSNSAVCQYSLSEKKYYSLGAAATDIEVGMT